MGNQMSSDSRSIPCMVVCRRYARTRNQPSSSTRLTIIQKA